MLFIIMNFKKNCLKYNFEINHVIKIFDDDFIKYVINIFT